MKIQAAVRGHLARQRILRLTNAAITLQVSTFQIHLLRVGCLVSCSMIIMLLTANVLCACFLHATLWLHLVL